MPLLLLHQCLLLLLLLPQLLLLHLHLQLPLRLCQSALHLLQLTG